MWRLGGKDGGMGDGWAATSKLGGFWNVEQRRLNDKRLTEMIIGSAHTTFALQTYSMGYSARDQATLNMLQNLFRNYSR